MGTVICLPGDEAQKPTTRNRGGWITLHRTPPGINGRVLVRLERVEVHLG